MSRKRRQYSSDFKVKVALATLKCDQTSSELAARFEVHLLMVSQLKRELLGNATASSMARAARQRRRASRSTPSTARSVS